MNNKLTFILLTYNEEKNIPACLDNISDIPANIFVVDSYSSDQTLEILKQRDIQFIQHPFENYSAQRNWAQTNNPFRTEWVFHLDADERLTPELRCWLINDFDPENTIDAYIFGRRAIFMGQWIKSHYNYHLRLYKSVRGKCEEKSYDQHFITSGKSMVIRGKDITSNVSNNLNDFIQSHNRWSLMEAIDILKRESAGEVASKLSGSPIEKKRWLKNNLFQKFPLFIRSFLYFNYRFIFQLGFLDGSKGLIFHFLQAFWFRFLIDAKVYEIRDLMKTRKKDLETILMEEYKLKI